MYQVRLAAGRELNDVQFPYKMSPTLYFVLISAIFGFVRGISVYTQNDINAEILYVFTY